MPSSELDLFIKEFYNKIPFNVAILDKNYNIVKANPSFEKFFGSWHNRTCYSLCKKKTAPCTLCNLQDVFTTGDSRVCEETNFAMTKDNKHLLVHLSPIKDDKGEVEFVVETSIDITSSINTIKEHNILFDKVPCYITILDNNLKILRSNEKFRETFGESYGKFCYNVYKKKKNECVSCPARECFEDKLEHQSIQVGITSNGDKTYYMVTAIPLVVNHQGVQLVIEIAQDITELTVMQEQFINIHEYYNQIIDNISDAVIALNDKGKVQAFNEPARRLFEIKSGRAPSFQTIQELLPPELEQSFIDMDLSYSNIRSSITTAKGKRLPVDFSGFQIKHKKKCLGGAVVFHDNTKHHDLERLLVESEKYTPCGQSFDKFGKYILRNLKEIQDNGGLNELTSKLEVFFSKISDEFMPSYVDTMSLLTELANKAPFPLKLNITNNIEPMLLQKKAVEEALINLSKFLDLYGDRENEIKLVALENEDGVILALSRGEIDRTGKIMDLFELAENGNFVLMPTLDILFSHKTLKNHKATISVFLKDNVISGIEIIFYKHKLKQIAENLMEQAK